MKVFLVGDYPKDGTTYGGVQGVLVNLANELIERHDITLVLVSTSGHIGFRKSYGEAKTHCLNFRSSFFKARKRFKELVATEKPDIIHLQGVVPGVLLYREEYRDVFAVTQHAILGKERLLQVSLGRKLLFWGKERIEDYYLKKIRNIIFISEYNGQVYFRKFPKKRDLNYAQITNPVNQEFFEIKPSDTVATAESSFKHSTGDPAAVDSSAKAELNPEKSIRFTEGTSAKGNSGEVYFVGEIKKRKGLHVLLRAIHMLRERDITCKVHVIGGFKESKYEEEIRKLIGDLDLAENVIFCGWKNQTEIIAYSAGIATFVLPSFQETLPLSVAEALCLGKIVVATDICGIPEMIENGVSGYLFAPGDVAALAEILENIILHPERQKSVTGRAKEESKKYHPKKVVDRTIEFYKSL